MAVLQEICNTVFFFNDWRGLLLSQCEFVVPIMVDLDWKLFLPDGIFNKSLTLLIIETKNEKMA